MSVNCSEDSNFQKHLHTARTNKRLGFMFFYYVENFALALNILLADMKSLSCRKMLTLWLSGADVMWRCMDALIPVKALAVSGCPFPVNFYLRVEL